MSLTTNEKIASTSFVNMIGNGFRVLVSFATAVFASRWLGAHGFGQFNLIMAYTVVFNYLISAGFDQSLPYFIARYNADGRYDLSRRVLKFGFLTSLLFGGGIFIIGLVLVPLALKGTSAAVLIVPALVLLAQTCNFGAGNVLVGYLRGTKNFLPTIIRDQILFPLFHLLSLAGFVWYLKMGVLGYALGYFLATLLSAVFILVFTLKALRTTDLLNRTNMNNLSDRKQEASPETEDETPKWKSWISVSSPLAMLGVLDPLQIWVSIMIAGWFVVESQVGQLAVALKLGLFVQFFFIAVEPIFGPYLAEFIKKDLKKELKELYQSIIYWSSKWAVLFAFVLVVSSDHILSIFGKEYSMASTCLLLLLPGCIFEGCFGSIKKSLIMGGHNKINVYFLVIGILVNVLAGISLIPKFGINGAAAAFALGAIVLNVLRARRFYALFGVLPLTFRQARNLVIMGVIVTFIAILINRSHLEANARLITSLLVFVVGILAVFWSDRKLFIGRFINRTKVINEVSEQPS